MMREDEGHAPRLVLIAEDEEPIAEALAFIVGECGYVAQLAVNGKEALELIRALRPALVVTDLMMPQLGGAELIAAVRADAARDGRKAPPIVLMSAAGKHYLAQVQADAMLPKPFDVAQVEALLAHFLGPGGRH